MKKLFFINLALFLVLALILVGCASSTPSPTTSAPPPQTTSAPPPQTSTSAPPPSTTTSAPPPTTSASTTPAIPSMTLTFNGAQFSADDVPGKSELWFCNEVTQKTNGAVKFNFVGSSSLTKPGEEVTALQNGLVDVGAFTMVYYPTLFYLNAGFPRAVPFDITDIPTATKVAYDIYYNDPASAGPLTAEFTKQGLKFLYMTIDDSYVIESKAAITTLAALKGKKMAVLGYEAKYFAPTGATVVGMPAGDRPTALQTGVIDAVATPLSISFGFHTYEFAPYIIQSGFGCVTGNAIVWNQNKFNALPKALQDILTQAGKDAFMHNSTIEEDYYKSALATREKDTGNPMTNFSTEDLATWSNLLGEPVSDWIKAAPSQSEAQAVAKAWIAGEEATGYKFPKEWSTSP